MASASTTTCWAVAPLSACAARPPPRGRGSGVLPSPPLAHGRKNRIFRNDAKRSVISPVLSCTGRIGSPATRPRVNPVTGEWLLSGLGRSRSRKSAPRRVTTACWSLEVSLATSAIVTATTAVLWQRNGPRDRGYALFLGVFGSMQLIDTALWYFDGTVGLEACTWANRVVSRVGITIILLEPIAAYLGTTVASKKGPKLHELAFYLALFVITPLSAAALLPSTLSDMPAATTTGEMRQLCQASGNVLVNLELLADVRAPCMCSLVTPQGHILYGGSSLVYNEFLGPLDSTFPTAVDSSSAPALEGGAVAAAAASSGEAGNALVGSMEIPLALRIAYLAAMAVPFAAKVEPKSCGYSHASILAITWMVGFFSDSHASVWCLANVAQSLLMLADPFFWPEQAGVFLPAGLRPGFPSPLVSMAGGRDAGGPSSPTARAPGSSRGQGMGGGALGRGRARSGRKGPRGPSPPRALPPHHAESGSASGAGAPGPPLEDAARSPRPVVAAAAAAAGRGTAAAFQTAEGAEKKAHRKESPAARFFKASRVPENLDAVVIGSGIGGLAFSALMAKAGKRVLVLEKHYRPGGCCHQFDEVGDSVFDSGIHYVGGGEMMQNMLARVCDTPLKFACMGSEEDGWLYDRFDLGDGEEPVEFRRGRKALVEGLVERFPHEEEGIRAYMEAVAGAGAGLDALMLSKMVPRSMPGARAVERALHNFAVGPRSRALDTAEQVISEYVQDPKLRAVLGGGQMIDWNLPPGKVSWAVAAGMMNYYINGGYYPVGGSQTIPEAVIPVIERAGGKVLCKAPVARILTSDGGRAIGVELQGGEVIHAPLVVSAAGFANTFERLLSPGQLAAAAAASGLPAPPPPSEALARLGLGQSHSHVCAFVTLDRTVEELQLEPCNIHSMPALATEFKYDLTRMQEGFYNDPFSQGDGCLMTLTCPAAKDPWLRDARPGTSNMILLVEGMKEWMDMLPDAAEGSDTYKRRSSGYGEFKRRFEEMFLHRLYHYYPACEGHVASIELSTPLTAEHFLTAPGGASYGLEWTPAHFERSLHEDWLHPVTPVPGLLLTGEAVCYGGFYGALATAFASAVHALGLPKFLMLVATSKKVRPEMMDG